VLPFIIKRKYVTPTDTVYVKNCYFPLFYFMRHNKEVLAIVVCFDFVKNTRKYNLKCRCIYDREMRKFILCVVGIANGVSVQNLA
jgi:hypothetical protein